MDTALEKVRAIAASLDDDERAELQSSGPFKSKGEIPPRIRQRLEEAAEGLTAEDREEIQAAARSRREMGEADDDPEDVAGFAVIRDHRKDPVYRPYRPGMLGKHPAPAPTKSVEDIILDFLTPGF